MQLAPQPCGFPKESAPESEDGAGGQVHSAKALQGILLLKQLPPAPTAIIPKNVPPPAAGALCAILLC